MSSDIDAIRPTRDVPCSICGETIVAGDLAHLLDRKTAAHLDCSIRQRRAGR